MAKKQEIIISDYISNNLTDYEKSLKAVKENAVKPLIVKSNTNESMALNAVEKVLKSKDNDKNFNAELIKLVNKKNIKPTVKKIYQTVMLTFFKTLSVEYDYNYWLNGNNINMSPKTISINDGYAEFTSSTACFEKGRYPFANITDDMLTDEVEKDYQFAKLTAKDNEKDSKESMRQFNEQLNGWIKDYQQKELGTARTLEHVHIYNKEYDYSEAVLLVPYLLVSYDLGDLIVTFPVCGINGAVDALLVNNPLAKFAVADDALPPKFSPLILIVASVVVVILGGIIYLAWYFSKKLTYKSKTLKNYTLEDLKKLL